MPAAVINQEVVERWAALAYGSAAGGTSWSELLTELAGACNAVGASLFTPVPDSLGRHFGESSGIVTPESMQGWMTYWRTQDPWNNAPGSRALFSAPGTVRHGHEFISDAELRRTAYYNEFSRPNEGGRLICLKVCGAGDTHSPTTHLTLLRPLSGKPFEPRVHDALRALWPHLRGALYGHWSMGPVHRARSVASAVLAALPQPAWLVRVDGGVLYANEAAEAEMKPGRSVRVASNRLCAIGELGLDHVSEAARRAARGLGWTAQTRVSVAGRTQRATVRWISLSGSLVASASGLTDIWPDAIALLLLDVARDDADEAWMDSLVARHGLTPSERRVLERLANGDSAQRIAECLQVSTVTVRTHLRSLFDKTGARRQSDLIRLVLGR